MGTEDYCVEGGYHSWNTPTWECACGDGMCCLECTECDAVDCYCEDA